MSVGVGISSSSWLQQDGVTGPVTAVMPDTTGNFSVFAWINNLLPGVAEPTVGDLLFELGVAGVAPGGGTAAFWRASGTLNGFLAIPNGTFDLGAIAVSVPDNRIYVPTTDDLSNPALGIWDGDGTFVAYAVLSASAYAVFVPHPGVVWVAVEGGTNGEIQEWTSAGVFVRIVANLTAADTGYIQAAYGMGVYGGFLYFNTLRGASYHAAAGIYKYDLANGGNAAAVLIRNQDTQHVNGFAIDPMTGNFWITQTPNTSVDRYNSAGSSVASTPTGTYNVGVAVDSDKQRVWVGDDTEDTITLISTNTNSVVTSFSSVANSEACDGGLGVPYRGTTGKTALALFTSPSVVTPSYVDPFVWVGISHFLGSQCISMKVSGMQTPQVISGIEKRAFGITYEAASGKWTFLIRRTAAWEVVGTLTQSFLGTPITSMRMLNDGIASIGSMSAAYFRLFNGRILTLEQFEHEANSGVAVTEGVTTDTPLIAVTDLTDVSGGNNPWNAV